MLSALRWISRGAVSPWNEEAFVDFVIALESLILGPRRDQELKYRLRLRCVHLLPVKSGFERIVFDRIGELYDRRSAVVHRGSMQISPDERSSARYFATAALLTALSTRQFSDFAKEEDVEEWFESSVIGSSKSKRRAY
jgi:hypothetical protein